MNQPCLAWAAACVDAAEGNEDSAFEEHLDQCESCRRAVEELRSDLALIQPDPAPVPGPWLASTIRRAFEEKKARTSKRFGLLLPAAAGAAVAIVVFAIGHKTIDPPTLEPHSASIVERSSAADVATYTDTEIAPFVWEEDWGVGVDGLLAHAGLDELEALLYSLPP